MSKSPMFEFHVSRAARDRYGFTDVLFAFSGNLVFANLAAVRQFAQRMNEQRDTSLHPERVIHPGALNAMGLIDEALHLVAALYRQQRDPKAMLDALKWFEARLGREALDRSLLTFSEQFPPAAVYRGEQTVAEWLAQSTGNVPHRAVALEELLMLWLANVNPAFRQFRELFDDQPLVERSSYPQITATVREYFETRPRFGPDNQNLVDMLRAPALASPDSLAGQLAYISRRWVALLGDFIERLLRGADILKEEQVAIWMRFHPPGAHFGGPQTLGDSTVAAVPTFSSAPFEYERFSADVEWMPRTVMIAKTVYVWLDQLSKTYRRAIQRLDEIPNEELDTMARRGFNALWLIGVWQRSAASQRIKQLTGNPEAAASAYSLADYAVAWDLGGEQAYQNLRDRAAARGIRLASDMVPNHMGIDSRWVIEHPDWFISLPYSPFPSYRFDGPDISSDNRAEIKIEDHYYDRTDAAVVFRRMDRAVGDTRFIYHGNDGTSFPWNDTAQLNYLNPEVREAVIQTILGVARRFPIIRFDAAMTLTKQHYQRLWFPQPGTGGAIPSRAEHGLTKEQFDAAMPNEFWRELVDRVAAEVPGTLLLAEAFWLLEGYFVRTLGMHRVYNSAFMNMLRDEANANYRSVLKNTLEFDPEVLKRYVNFMNNPDERTAVDQFGKGDKYFGVCMMMATLPGLPMFGHGQIEGFTERYGMEYRRAYYDEAPDSWLVARHEREISPLLHRRALFAEVKDFLLYDFFRDDGAVNEDVFAYSNQLNDERALVVYNNAYNSTSGWIRTSCAYAEKHPDGSKSMRQRAIGEAFGLSHDRQMFVAYRDAASGLEYLHRARDMAEKGLRVELGAYRYNVFLDWRDLRDDGVRPWEALCEMLAGRGVSSLDDELRVLELKPVHEALRSLLDPNMVTALIGEHEPEPTASGKAPSRATKKMSAKPAKSAQKAEARTTAPKNTASKNNPAKKPAPATQTREEAVEDATRRIRVLLEQSLRLASSTEDALAVGLEPSRQWTGDINKAVELFRQRLTAALRLSEVQAQFANPWPEVSCDVLPTSDSGARTTALWSTVIAWCALEAMGYLRDPKQPDAAAASLFDHLRLREPMAEAFAECGLLGEERWRAAARVRASFAYSEWSAVSELAPGHLAVGPFTWMHDPDVIWLLGIHEYEGVRYLVKEPFEKMVCWMALRNLIAIGSEPVIDPEKVSAVEQQLARRLQAAAQSGYQIDTLFARLR